ncbi:hypothetical protein CONPUDRAFT_18585, partial [Coniophora puteana RWD-64-598 SS2]
WSKALQQAFEKHLARLTASANFLLSWVDNPEWHAFCHDFIPAAKVPSQYTMARHLIPQAVSELRTAVKQAVKGHESTLQADGWTGINNHHLLAFMITTQTKIHTVNVYDVSKERKTANKLLEKLEEVIKNVNDSWGSKVIAVVTDASGE